MGKYANINTANWRDQLRELHQTNKAKRAETDPPSEYRPFEFIYPEDFFDLLELAWRTPEVRTVFEDVCRPDHNGPKGPHFMTDEQNALTQTFGYWFSLLLPYHPLNHSRWRDRLRYMCTNGTTDPRDPEILEQSLKYLAMARKSSKGSKIDIEAHTNFKRKGRTV